jgi:iron complex outermembrane receptor protein
MRIGGGDEAAAFRISAAQRGDSGLAALNDDKRVRQFHARGDLRPTAADEVMLASGAAEHGWGAGQSGVAGDPVRMEYWRDTYAHVQWRRQLGAGEDIRLSMHVDEEQYRGTLFVKKIGSQYVQLSTDGTAHRVDLDAQHSFPLGAAARFVWGGEYRREEVDSPGLFATKGRQSDTFLRGFANLELRPYAQWLINVGGLYEHHDITGDRLAPRLMANYHVLPGHTLRAGVTTAYRTPTLFELRGDWRWNGIPFVVAKGNARAERMDVAEVGYLGDFRAYGLKVDMRGFREKMESRTRFYGNPNDVINRSPTLQHGWETQLRWQPLPETQVVLNHTALRITDTDNEQPADRFAAPSHFSSLAVFQSLPEDFDLGIIYTMTGQMAWVSLSDMLPAAHQLDLRLARKFRVGSTRAEAALVVQAVEATHYEFLPGQVFKRRAFATLRFDF